jgi:hypothetical protein
VISPWFLPASATSSTNVTGCNSLFLCRRSYGRKRILSMQKSGYELARITRIKAEDARQAHEAISD